MIITILVLVQGIVYCFGNDGYVTVLNIFPQSNSNTGYQFYIPTTFTGYNLSYGRSFAVANDENLNETSWDVPGDKVKERYVTGEVGMGVYYCKILKDGDIKIVQTTKIRDDALITPGKTKNTVTVNVGDDVTISFNTDLNSDFEWRKDGSPPFKNDIDKSMTFNSVEISDSGVYEMYKSGNRSERLHSFIKLIVRECPRHQWGPTDCTGDCEYCYNGGVCDDKTGFCICAPGFSGSTCEIECGGNKHGWNCENYCTHKTRDNACRYYQFCLPDPYGCSCVTGYRGLKCDTVCPQGTFGADCAQTCHCKQGDCDRYTGICTNSSCAFPWMGTNCQKCQPQFYGENCEIECNKPCECHRVTGRCMEGTCDSNWLEPDCKVEIIDTAFVPANNNQDTTASCSVKHYGTKNTTTMIMVTNKHLTENITKLVEIEQDGENITTYTFSVTSNVDSTYKCVIVHEGFSAQREIVAQIFRLPFYTGSMTVLNISSSFITIEWTVWNSNTDDGDGPVVGYFLYHKLSNTIDWKRTLYNNFLSGTVDGLMWDTEYTFGVSALRPGEGGEGPIGETTFTAKTLCGRPPPVQNAKHRVSIWDSNSIQVTWIVPDSLNVDLLKCYNTNSGMYTVYFKTIDIKECSEKVYHTNASQLTIQNITVDDPYLILVSLSNKDSESELVRSSNDIENGGICAGFITVIIISICQRKLRKNVSKSDGEEKHIYQDYAAASNNSEYSSCNPKIVTSSNNDDSTDQHVYQNCASYNSSADNYENPDIVKMPENQPYEIVNLFKLK